MPAKPMYKKNVEANSVRLMEDMESETGGVFPRRAQFAANDCRSEYGWSEVLSGS